MRIQVILTSIFLILTFFTDNQAFSQEYVKNITASQIGNEIVIKYDLVNSSGNNFLDPKKRIKSGKFNISLNYSINGTDFEKIDFATGDIGSGVSLGSGKTIIWSPENQLQGMIGNVVFQIDPDLILPKISIGLSYSRGFVNFVEYLGDLRYFNTFNMNLYFPLINGNGSLMIPVFYSKYNLGKNEFFENEIYEGNAINTGLGWQSNKRDFSIYAAFGMSTSNLEGSTISLISGIDVKLFDINICTILLPIRMHIEGEAKVIQSGLSLQF